MNYFLSVLLITTLLSCSNNQNKKNDKGIIESIKPEKIDLIKQDIEKAEKEKNIIQVASSFYKWYLKNTSDLNSEISTRINIIKNKNGKCKLDYESYFSELRKLNSISEKFIENEKTRTLDCNKYIQKIDWVEFQKSEGYDYDQYCGFLYYSYWTRTQEDFDGFEVININQKNNYCEVLIQFYTLENGEKHYINETLPIIKVEKENNEYLITEINWKE